MKETVKRDGSRTFEMTGHERQRLLSLTAIPLFLSEEANDGFIMTLGANKVGDFLAQQIRKKANEAGIMLEQVDAN